MSLRKSERIVWTLRRAVRVRLHVGSVPDKPPMRGMTVLIVLIIHYYFDCVLRNNDDVLRGLLSKRVDITYNFRTRCHGRTILEKKGHLTEKNFITWMLYKNAY